MTDPCEGCTPRIKVAILAESGEHGVPHPCAGCIPRIKIAILAESTILYYSILLSITLGDWTLDLGCTLPYVSLY